MASLHSKENIRKRRKTLKKLLAEAKLDALVLNAGTSFTYFSGLHFHLMERPIVAFLPAEGATIFVLPEMEKGKVNNLEYEARTFTYGEDPTHWQNSFSAAAKALGLEKARIGVEDSNLRLLELRYLQAALPKADFVNGEEVVAAMRQRKGVEEIAAMQRAAEIAEDALLATLPKIKVGVSETRIAADLLQALLQQGSDPEVPFFPIVASGPNSANPHATRTERALQSGDLLVIDWGANVDGYYSDITRTFAIGEIDEELYRIYAAVELANSAGRAASKPGISCGAVDEATRAVIEGAGYREYFIHRTGHGLGMQAHEAPYIRSGNLQKLESGMVFTIEPGIYLPGKGGVRIEDDVVVTEDGLRSLSKLPRELQTLEG